LSFSDLNSVVYYSFSYNLTHSTVVV